MVHYSVKNTFVIPKYSHELQNTHVKRDIAIHISMESYPGINTQEVICIAWPIFLIFQHLPTENPPQSTFTASV